MQARIVRPHPLTMQRVAYVTRGPIVYCVEDIDHPWEGDHFKVRETYATLLFSWMATVGYLNSKRANNNI